MKEHLLRFNKKQKFLVFDFETCSLNLASKNNKPWQLAYAAYEGDNIKDQRNIYIKWENLPISEEARRITKFNELEYQKKSIDPSEALQLFEKYLYDPSYIKVGHNILGFDIYMHNILRKCCGLKSDYSFINETIDTLCIAKSIKKDICVPKDRKHFALWQFKLTSIYDRKMKNSIKALCKEYDIAFDENKLHDALYDISLNYEIFKKQIWQAEI